VWSDIVSPQPPSSFGRSSPFVLDNHRPLPIGDWIIYLTYTNSFVGSHNCERIQPFEKHASLPCPTYLLIHFIRQVFLIIVSSYLLFPCFPSLSHLLIFISYISIRSLSFHFLFKFSFPSSDKTILLLKPLFWFWFSSMPNLLSSVHDIHLRRPAPLTIRPSLPDHNNILPLFLAVNLISSFSLPLSFSLRSNPQSRVAACSPSGF